MVVLGVFIIHRFDRFLSLVNVLLIVVFAAPCAIVYSYRKKSGNPILPVISLSTKSTIGPAVTTAAISFAVFFAVLALIPFYLEYIFLYPADKVGRLMMAVPATIVVLSPCIRLALR